jgi:hypothetical protein
MPGNWTPHITLGYMPSDADLPTFTGSVSIESDRLIASMDDGDGYQTLVDSKDGE